MADLLEWLARRLVDEPDAVRVETEEREDAIVFHLHVAPDDVGKVIGKQGRLARALRSIVRAGGARADERYVLEIAGLTPSPRSFASAGSAGRTAWTVRSSSRMPATTRPDSRSAPSSWSTASPLVSPLSRQVGGRRRAIKLDRAALRGAELAVRRDELSPLPSDAYYVADLIGLTVLDERGVRVGVVRDVLPGPANDALELDTGLLLPLVEDCVREVDLAGRRVHLNPGFTD